MMYVPLKNLSTEGQTTVYRLQIAGLFSFLLTSTHFPLLGTNTAYSWAPYLLSGLSGGEEIN